MPEINPHSIAGKAICALFIKNGSRLQIIQGQMYIDYEGWIWHWENFREMNEIPDVDEVVKNFKLATKKEHGGSITVANAEAVTRAMLTIESNFATFAAMKEIKR